MALITTDRVKENASVIGFGDAVLIGNPAGFKTFSSVMAIGDTCYYSIVDTGTGYWETGIGTLINVNLLQRTTVKTSSSNDDKVSFIAGDKTISLALTSDQFVNLVAATLTQSDITSLVDARYVQLDNNIAQSVTGSGTFGVASSSGVNEASVVWDYALGVESSYSDDTYISTFNLRTNQSSWTVQDLVSSQNINVVLTSTSFDLFYNGNYTETDDSILTRSMMDTRYQAVGAYLTSANLTFANLTGKPTTLAGYGITDGLTSANLTPYLTITSANSTFAVLGHTHEISNVTGLQTALDAKLPSSNFTYANITGKPTLANVATSGNYTDLVGKPALTISGAFDTILTVTANTSVTLPTTGTLATLAGSETLANKTLSTNVDYNGNVVLGQYGGTGIANTGKTITIGGNLTTSGAFTTTLTSTANTSLTLPTTGTLATIAGSEILTNKTLSTDTTWNGNVIAGQYGGTGVANTGKTITIGGNLTTSGAFDTTITVTAGTSITLPTAGTLATLAGSETFTNKTFSTNTTWNGDVIAGQYGGTGVANTGRTITIGGNLTTLGSFTTTLTSTANTSITLPTTGTLATLAGTETLSNKYITTGAGNTTVAGLILTSGTNTTAVANGSIEFDNTNFYFSVAGARKTVAYLDSNITGTWSGTVVAGQYGGTGIANTGKTITIGGNLTTSGAFTTTLTSTANTSITLPTVGTLSTLAGIESFTNKTLSTNTTWNGNVIPGQYGGTGIANTGFTLTMAGNVSHAGAFAQTFTATGTTSVTLPTAGTIATLAGVESFTNKTLSTNTTWNGNVIAGLYGGTGVANTGKTITIGGNLTTSGAFTTTFTSTANTSVTLPTAGTLSTLAGSETLTNKTFSTNTTWNGNVIAGQYGGTGVANTGKTITIGGNLTTSGAFTTTFTSTANTSVTLPTTGTLATLAGIESLSNKYITTGAGNTTVAGLVLTSGSNTTAVANGSIEFDNTNFYFSVAGARKVNAYLDSAMTGTWTGTVVAGQYGGTGIANTGKTITIGGNLTTSGAFTTTLTATANTSVTLPTAGTLATLAGIESFTNKTLSTNTTWNGNVIPGQYGGTGIANTGFTLTMAGNVSHAGAFAQTFTATGTTSVTLPTTGTLATLAGVESFTNKTLSTNTTWNGNVIPGQYGGTGIANTGFTLTMAGNVSHAGAFARTLTATGTTSVTLPTAGTLATLAGLESFTNKTLSTNTTWNGNVIAGQYGGTGVANTGKTITIGGNLTTSGAFDVTLTTVAATSVTLPTAGTLSTLAGSETFTNKTLSTNTTWNGNVIAGQYGGTGIANTGKTITIGGNLTTSGAFTTTLTATANTSVTLPVAGTLATLAGTESLSNKYITTSAGNTTAAGLVLTSGSNTTAVANGSIEFDNTNYYFSFAGSRKVNAYLDSNLTGTWSGAVVAGQYGGTGAANTGKTITIGGNLTTSGAFTTTLTSTANTSVTLPTTGTLATLAGIESFTNKTLSTNTTWNGNVIPGQYGGTGIANTGFTLTMAGNVSHAGAFAQTLTATGTTSVTLPTTGTLATLAGIESFTNKTMSTNTTWNGNVIPGQYGGTGIANTGFTLTMAGNVSHAGAFTQTFTATGTTSVTLPTAGTLATLAGIESFTNKTMSTNTTWNGNVIPGQYGGTGIANTGFTLTMAGNVTHAGAFARTLTATGTTSITLPTAGTLATLAGIETLSNKTVNLAAGNATTGPLRFTSGTNMTAAAAGNMEFNGTRLLFTPSTTRETVAFLTDITGGLTVADDTSSNATRYLIFTNATSGSVSTANTSSSKLYFNPSTGDLTAGGSITALSDRTLKNNITTITGAVDKVNNLRGVEFDWIESGGHGIGMIAQEVEDIIPEVVLTHKGLKSVAYGNLIAVLIEAIKDQDKRIKLLEALVERLVK